ncbi:cyclin [Ceratobasidium sp. AG-Ba]|nr:cyclin [Ceratobasidium sp. AG-Ba]
MAVSHVLSGAWKLHPHSLFSTPDDAQVIAGMLAVAPQAAAVTSHVGWERPRTTTTTRSQDPPRRTPLVTAPSAPASTTPAPAAVVAQPTPTPTLTMSSAPQNRPRPTITSMQRLPDGSLDLGSYPSTDLLRLLAALLTQITTTNDRLREPAAHAPPTPPTDPVPDHLPRPAVWSQLTTASRSALGSPAASLAFHARNIPSITIEQYLLRILKYCPTTNEVFLGLIVYFDRMSKLAAECLPPTTPSTHPRPFAIDSYNIHRLLIAGVTVASKFFSDVFYTNSRYAKVGGLPQSELNQLELQFLLLNNFRLNIPIDEMQRYAEQLLRYSAGMSPEDAFAPSATAPPPTLTPVPPAPQPAPAPSPSSSSSASAPFATPHRPAHLQLRPNTNTPVVGGASPGHLSTSFSTNSFPRMSHHDVEARAWHDANLQPRPSAGAGDAASIYSVDASESGYGSTTDEEPTIRAHWSSSESVMTEDGDAGTDTDERDRDRDEDEVPKQVGTPGPRGGEQ